MHTSFSDSPVKGPAAHPITQGAMRADVQVIADRYGWSVPMAQWWMNFAASSVGSGPETVCAFLDRTVGGAAMICRR